MIDEIDHLKQAFEATKPEPDEAARRRAIASATQAFDRESAAASQGTAAEARPTKQRANLLARLFGGLAMLTYRRLTPIMLGGASAATIAIAAFVALDYPEERIENTGFGIESTSTGNFAPTGGRANDERTNLTDANEALDANEAPPLAAAPSADLSAAQSSPGNQVADKTEGSIRMRRAGDVSGTAGESRETYQPFGGGLAKAPVEAEAMAPAPAPHSAVSESKRVHSLVQPKADDVAIPTYDAQGRDAFADFETNPVTVVAEEPVSTFSIDVDTASYAFVRRQIMAGVLPQKDAVRVEEMVNYFPYDYPLPDSGETPFRADIQVIPTPWNTGTQLMRIGIQGYQLAEAEKPRSNLVFLIDSSGSMNAPDKLPLLKNALKLMLRSLDPDDTVAIVTYAGSAGTVLEPTPVSEGNRILAALEHLSPGGSTAGAEGIRQAYRLAEANYDREGINRVILATDGDFNVGITDPGELQGFVERKRETGVLLSVLGFGQGNLNDALMQALAQNGNGQAAYIDTLAEARKALVEEAGGALFPIAQDVKLQIEFNPAAIAEYRLIGYETRMLRREDFNNDRVDAGEIGSGHRVTALYEVTPAGAGERQVDALRYQPAEVPEANPSELAFLKIRYKQPGGSVSRLIERPVTRADVYTADDVRTRETRFAAAVAAFGQLLRGGRHMGDFGYADVAALAGASKGADPFGYRTEFTTLVRLAKSAAALEPQKP